MSNECPHCGGNSVQFGHRTRMLKAWSEERGAYSEPVLLQRYICKDCGATHSDNAEGVEPGMNMTKTMAEEIRCRLADGGTVNKVAQQMLVTPGTVRKVAGG